jgi:magnesium transporter
LCCPRVVDPKFWNELRKHRDNFNFVKRSLFRFGILYAIKSLKEDKDFKVIEVEIFSYFFLDCIKSLELLEEIDSDMGC